MSTTAATPGTSARILVIEDDAMLSELLLGVLREQGFGAEVVANGTEALQRLRTAAFDLALLDVNLPGVSGLEVLACIHAEGIPCRVIMMTADLTPATVLQAVREQACRYLPKPFTPSMAVQMVREVLADSAPLPIEVASASPEWVELLVPCQLSSANRVQEFLVQLDADLPTAVRESVGLAFRELLLNAVEWGGKLNPLLRVRIACLRTRRMLLYRICDPGLGFRLDASLKHAAISNTTGNPTAHFQEREAQGLRPGGLGLLMTRALVDELIFNEAHNEVIFVKYLD
ncbi:MAG: ATP-binding protein [Terriglobales bacterium]